MAVLVLSMAAAGLAASTLLVTAGSAQPEPPTDVPQVLCRDQVTGQVLVSRTGHCAPREQSAVPVRPDGP